MSLHVSTRRSMPALWVVFFVNGAVLASWAPRIPQIKAELSLTDGQLGWALLGVAAGSLPALLGTARVLKSVSAQSVSVHSVCVTASVAFAGGLPLVALASNGWQLGFALTALGAAGGCLDVAMNTAAIDHQSRSGVRILSRMHGGYSLGVLAGASSGAMASKFGFAVLEHLLAVSVVLLLFAFAAASSLPGPTRHVIPKPTTAPASSAGLRYSPPSPEPRMLRALAIPLCVGVMAVAALLVEGMVTDWSALLVSRDFGGGATVGATTVVVFSCAMFVSRSLGDLIIDRLGSRMTVVCGALVMTSATLIGLLVQHSPWGVLAAMAFIGLALGPVFPLLITEAGQRSPAGVAVATARVSAVGYGAYLAGPPLVGFLADHTGLSSAFAMVTCTCSVALAHGARSLRHLCKSRLGGG